MKILLTSDVHRGMTQKTHEKHEKFLKEVSLQDVDIVVIAGDICSGKQDNLESFFKAYRTHIPTKPTYAVRGNHEYFNIGRKQQLGIKIANWNDVCAKYNIVSLDGQMVEVNGIKMYGWHNWYGTARHLRGTNDEYHLEIEEDLRLYKDDMDSFWRYIDAGVKADVLINHMPIVPNAQYKLWNGIEHQWEALKEQNMQPRVYLHGHTHQERDIVIDGVRVVMCGSDYDKPAYKIVEVL